VAVPSTPERTYRWPSVLAAGAISVILVGSIGWIQIYQPQELDWPTMKSMVLGRSFERMVPESELPYVTVMPLVPISNKPNIVKRESKTSTQLR
jgi:hypothetical protein